MQTKSTLNLQAEPLEIIQSDGFVDYEEAMATMNKRVAEIQVGNAAEALWLLEHPDLYTAGTSAQDSDLLDASRFPVYKTGRGGEYTYHGPGQRVAYVMLDLKRREQDLRLYIKNLEQWMINTLAHFNVEGERRQGRVGIWVKNGNRENKIGAIGVRIRKWVTLHGISLNIDPNLQNFGGIIPCGISQHGVTSIYNEGHTPSFEEVDAALIGEFRKIFYLTRSS